MIKARITEEKLIHLKNHLPSSKYNYYGTSSLEILKCLAFPFHLKFYHKGPGWVVQ